MELTISIKIKYVSKKSMKHKRKQKYIHRDPKDSPENRVTNQRHVCCYFSCE